MGQAVCFEYSIGVESFGIMESMCITLVLLGAKAPRTSLASTKNPVQSSIVKGNRNVLCAMCH